jgi:hypothetical protein
VDKEIPDVNDKMPHLATNPFFFSIDLSASLEITAFHRSDEQRFTLHMMNFFLNALRVTTFSSSAHNIHDGKWDVLAKFCDNGNRIPHHLHPCDQHCKSGLSGKPESYHYDSLFQWW